MTNEICSRSRSRRDTLRVRRRQVRGVVNANELKQVILNLIKNGFESMPDGGTISVTTDEAVHDGVPTAGLGLSVGYAILERYSGKLLAEDLPGGGCRFTMALPQSDSRGGG